MELLDFVVRQTDKYIDSIPREERKKYGQFFTSNETAIFMANLFDIPENKTTLCILDTGAGTGILSAALIQRLQGISSLQKIKLVCYENDGQVVDVLKQNLNWIREHSVIQVDYEIRESNYILEQENEYNCTLESDFNLLKYDILVKLKEFFGFLERVRKRARKQKCIDFKAFLTSPLNSIGICK